MHIESDLSLNIWRAWWKRDLVHESILSRINVKVMLLHGDGPISTLVHCTNPLYRCKRICIRNCDGLCLTVSWEVKNFIRIYSLQSMNSGAAVGRRIVGIYIVWYYVVDIVNIVSHGLIVCGIIVNTLNDTGGRECCSSLIFGEEICILAGIIELNIERTCVSCSKFSQDQLVSCLILRQFRLSFDSVLLWSNSRTVHIDSHSGSIFRII